MVLYRESESRAGRGGGPGRIDISLQRPLSPSDRDLVGLARSGFAIAQDMVLCGGRMAMGAVGGKCEKVRLFFSASAFWNVQVGGHGQGGWDTCRPLGHG